ncbi:MAG: transposase [Acidobacteria bacterium]|nr:transposase [Acidobacteriota bacterium]
MADRVASALRFGARELHLYELFAWAIMPNHVHILVKPQAPLARLTHAVKTYSAREANRLLGRTELPFWQKESFDRWVRDGKEFDNIVRYIEGNPVKAGLVSSPQEWPWSSAHKVGQEADATTI